MCLFLCVFELISRIFKLGIIALFACSAAFIFQCAIKKIRYTSRVVAYWAKFGFWSIVSKRIKMLEKNAFLQELHVRIYQKADRRCQIEQQSLKFLLWFKYSGLKACLCFKHCLIPKIEPNYYNDHSSGSFHHNWENKMVHASKEISNN